MKCHTMSFEVQSSNRNSRPSGDMGFTFEVKRSLRPQEPSKVVKQKILSPRANQTLKLQDKQKIESPFGQPYLERHHELRQSAGDGLIFQPKTSRNSQMPWIGRKVNEDDELVMHMSNLPGYLQRVEKGENSQEKALNFGVLDWERLEKWKYNKKPTPPKSNTNASSSGSNSSFKAGGSSTPSSKAQSKNLAPYKKQPPSHCPHLNSSHEECFSQGVKQSWRKVMQQDFEIAPGNNLDGQRKPHRTGKSSGRNYSETMLERSKRKDADQKITSEKETSLSGLRKHGFLHTSKDKTSAQTSVVTSSAEELQASEYYLGQKLCPGKHKSTVLLLPKHSPKRSCSEVFQPSEPRALIDRKSRETNRVSFSDGFLPEEDHSAELYSEISHSCPLPVGVENSETGMRPHRLTHAQSTELLNDASRKFLRTNEAPAMLSHGKCINENASSVKPSSANAIDISKRLDHEATEPATTKGRHSSSNRWFSFGLGKISRSLSFKESSAVPQLSSTYATVKSGPVRCEASDGFSSEEVHSTEFYYDILHSSPLPVRVETTTESDVRRHSLSTAQCSELPYDASCMFMCPSETPNTPHSANAIRTSEQLERATKPAAAKGRHPSPNRRFSFSLGRMSRSFSFKESSTVPQLSSTYASVKSGPVRSEMSDSLDNASRSKANTRSRAGSSPLRRLLQPLLKTFTNPHHSAETIQPLTGNLNLTSKVGSSTESLEDERHEASTVQALLQLTIKNGLPLFKFVVSDNDDILVAMKKLTTSGKDDAGWTYTFYCVREIKKRSGSWINQGHNGKNNGFVYNIVGQMKVFSSHYPDLAVQSSGDQFTVRESVMCSVDLRRADQETQEITPSRELAAIILKIPIGNSCDVGDQRNKGKELMGKGFMECSQEDRNSFRKVETELFNCTTVILPGGVHGLPNKGLPSPLIDRWKSGGSCDCGGWDIGCKLRILTTEDQRFKLPRPSRSCSNPDHFDLFDQRGAEDNRPIFSLATLKKGIYTVEFSASISLLQAFSICVAVISNQKSFHFAEANTLSEAKLLQDTTLTGRSRMKTTTKVRGDVPAKYIPSPPPSPVGRV